MKNKTPLILVEQLVMLLVFSLASALCIRAFALAERTSSGTQTGTALFFLPRMPQRS